MTEPKIMFEQDDRGRITVKAANEGVLLTKDEADRVAAKFAELEARISELARENAELKQVPRHVDGAPRCPLRDDMTGEMGVCVKECAWLMRTAETEQYSMCAVALMVCNQVIEPWTPINYWNEVD